MKYNELSKEEQELILNNRLHKLNMQIHSGACKMTGTVLTKDDNKIALALEDEYANKQILLTLSEDQITVLYNFLKSRYTLVKELNQLNVIEKVKVLNVKTTPEKYNAKKPF